SHILCSHDRCVGAGVRPLVSGISVSYDGWANAEYPYLIFTVYNGTSSRIVYKAYTAGGSPFAYIEIKGKDKTVGHCGTGLQDFELEAGKTLQFKAHVQEFIGPVRQHDQITIGTYLGIGTSQKRS